MSKLQEKQAELIKLRGQFKTLWDSKPDRDFTEDESANLITWNEAMAPLVDEVKRLEIIEAAAKTNDAEHERLTKGTGIVHPNGETKGQSRAEYKALVEMMGEQQEFKALADQGRGTATIEVPQERFFNPAQYKTLVTLATYVPQNERQPGILDMALETRSVRDLFRQGRTTANTIEYYEETTFTNNAAAVSEGGTKPESAIGFTLRSDATRKLAHWIPVTREALMDIPLMEGYIEGRLRFGLEREIEDQIINGDGTAPNISGILDRVGIQTTAATAANQIDAFMTAITLIQVNAFAQPSGIIMHPNDYAAVATLRTADGIYLLGNPQATPNISMWGLPIRVTTAATENTAIVGAFSTMAQILYREDITITASSEHSTYFIENKVAILAETRLALQVFRPAAFCTVTGL